MEIYIIALLSTILSLSAWQVLQKGVLGEFMQVLFYISALCFVGTTIMFFSFGNLSVIQIIRDLIVVGAISSFFILLKKNQFLSIVALVGLTAAIPNIFSFLSDNMKPPAKDPVKQVVINHDQQTKYDPEGEILFEIFNGKDIQSLDMLKEEYGLQIKPAFSPEDYTKTDLDDYYTVDIPDGKEANMSEILDKLRQQKIVEWVEPNEVLQNNPIASDLVPVKPIKKYAVNDPLNESRWDYAALKMNEYYQYIERQKIKPRKKAKLFILDTGVDAQHEDIKGQFKIFNDYSATDEVGHGTHCTGIAAAISNNKIGVSSMIPKPAFVEVSGIKVLSGFGFGTQKTIIDGMINAVDAGADVISMSLGGRSNQSREKAYDEAIQYARDHGTIVITAAGNSGRDAAGYSPANSQYVLCVSAVDQQLKRTAFSNTLQHIKYGIAAPGKDIHSTYPKNEYKTYSGTSMAAPFVAGLVTMMKSIRPEITVEDVHYYLHKTGLQTDEPLKTGNIIQPKAAIELFYQELAN